MVIPLKLFLPQREGVMRTHQRVKGKVERQQMGLAPVHMSKQGISYVRSKGKLMKHTRSCRMAGLAMEIRFRQLSLQR